ncbi:MAG: class I SAM-dependent methyltransferase [Novosphingobium sp.]|jgi:SAM-dependent methyltransferase|nr:methyltransferase domain-containing protein [Brevundimonas sp.]MCZ8321503.1 methyltransferase domain-containing protein [Novosphingobium sp.]
MKIDSDLLTDFVARYPAQPATAFWRGIEIDILAQAGIPDGLGLDLGCGDGILTDILFERIGRKPRLVGIDPDPLETDAARQYDFYERIHTVGGDAIPEADATFDYVVSNSVLEHIPDLEPVIREVGRVLKPGGKFYYTVPCPGFHDNLAGSVIPGISRQQYLASIDKRLAHFNYLTSEDWQELCSRHGMTVTAVTGFIGKKATRRWETLSRMTGGLLHTLSLGAKRPIEIQRALKLRDLQNSGRFPRGIAAALTSLIASGLGGEDVVDHPSGLLVVGERNRVQ